MSLSENHQETQTQNQKEVENEAKLTTNNLKEENETSTQKHPTRELKVIVEKDGDDSRTRRRAMIVNKGVEDEVFPYSTCTF